MPYDEVIYIMLAIEVFFLFNHSDWNHSLRQKHGSSYNDCL